MYSSEAPTDMFWENEQNSKRENILSFCKVFCMTSCTLILFLVVVLVVLFSQQEQTDILQMFSVSDCEEYTPTTKEMNDYMFKILMVSNIMIEREDRLPKDKGFFARTPKMASFIREIIQQSKYFKWKEIIKDINPTMKNMNRFYEDIKLDDYINKHRIGNMDLMFKRNPLTVDPKFQNTVYQNINIIVENAFPKEFYHESTHLGPSFELLKEYLNYNNCYCMQTSPVVMLFGKPSDFKYCKPMSWLLFYNSGTTLIGALIIVITNEILYKLILFFFQKVSFRSRSTKAASEVIAIALALFFNTLVNSYNFFTLNRFLKI